MKKIFIVAALMSLLGCTKKDCNKSIALFFNPVSELPTTYRFKASANKQLIIDTIIRSAEIDQSVLIKCFDSESVTKLDVTINSKKTVVKLDSLLRLTGPTSVFLHYDSKIKLELLFESYNKKSIETTGRIPKYETFVDSLTLHGAKSNQFDSIRVFAKKDRCWCDKREP